MLSIYLVTGLNPSDSALQARGNVARVLGQAIPGVRIVLKAHTDTVDLTQAGQGPIMLVGHSFGADQCIAWCEAAGEQRIEAMILLDPVPQAFARRMFRGAMVVPDCVGWAVCFHRMGIRYPLSKSIAGGPPSRMNVPLRIGHDDFYAHPSVIDTIHSKAVELAGVVG